MDHAAISSAIHRRSVSVDSAARAGDTAGYRLYRRRWFILAVFSCLFFMQGYIFNQWSAIYASLAVVFGLTDRLPAITSFYNTLIYAVFVVPSAIAVERFGFRAGVLASALMMLGSCVIRSASFIHNITFQTVMVHLSSVMNSFGGLLTWFGPPVLAARWFGPNERKFATAIGISLNEAGIGACSLIGPALVGEPGRSDVTLESMRGRYFIMTWVQVGILTCLAIMICTFFPEYPKSPPSPSADEARIDYGEAIRTLLRSRSFWLVFAPFFLITGSICAWAPIFPVVVGSVGIDEKTAGSVSFWGTMVGVAFGIGVGVLADAFPRNLKAITLTLALLTAIGSVWFVLIMMGWVAGSIRSVYIAVILILIATSGYIPLAFEMAADVCYPVDESVVGALLGLMAQLETSGVLVIMFFKNIPLGWANWFLAASSVLSIPFVLIIRVKYKRSQLDNNYCSESGKRSELDKTRVDDDENSTGAGGVIDCGDTNRLIISTDEDIIGI